MTRIQAGIVVLAAIPVMLLLMRLGWRARLRDQPTPAEPASRPQQLGQPLLGPLEATYVTSTAGGDRFDRVVGRELGHRSRALVTVTSDGVAIDRRGAPDLWIPVADLRGCRRQSGMVGSFVGRDGLVVVSWRLGAQELDTGLRTRHAADRARLTEQVAALVTTTGSGT